MPKFHVDAEKCIQCDACVQDCLFQIIKRPGRIPEAPAGPCLECQHCLTVCPTGALSVLGLNPDDSLPLTDLPSYGQMKTLVRGRRSVRQFLDQDVEPGLLDQLLADLAHAPTGCNDRDLRFTVVADRRTMADLREQTVAAIEAGWQSGLLRPGFMADAVAAWREHGQDVIFRNAPHLLVVSPGPKAHCVREDPVLALAYFELLAQSAGLGTTWCGMIKNVADQVPQVRAMLGLEPDVYFYAMIFGPSAVRYARTAQRDHHAQIRRLDQILKP